MFVLENSTQWSFSIHRFGTLLGTAHSYSLYTTSSDSASVELWSISGVASPGGCVRKKLFGLNEERGRFPSERALCFELGGRRLLQDGADIGREFRFWEFVGSVLDR